MNISTELHDIFREKFNSVLKFTLSHLKDYTIAYVWGNTTLNSNCVEGEGVVDPPISKKRGCFYNALDSY